MNVSIEDAPLETRGNAAVTVRAGELPAIAVTAKEEPKQEPLSHTPDALARASSKLQARSDEILKKSSALSKRSAAAQARATTLQQKHFRIVTPNKLNLAVSRYARVQGYSRVCFVVVKLEGGRVCHIGQHFPTTAAAKLYARSYGRNGYFYSLNQRQTPGQTELFPSLEQIQNYLDSGTFFV